MSTPSPVTTNDRKSLVLAELLKSAVRSNSDYYCVLYDHELFFREHFLGDLRIEGNLAYALLALNDYLKDFKYDLLANCIEIFDLSTDPTQIAKDILKGILEPSHNFFKLIPCPVPGSLKILTRHRSLEEAYADAVKELQKRSSDASNAIYKLTYDGSTYHNDQDQKPTRVLFKGNLPRAILAAETYVKDNLHNTMLLDMIHHYMNSKIESDYVVRILSDIGSISEYGLELCTDKQADEIVY